MSMQPILQRLKRKVRTQASRVTSAMSPKARSRTRPSSTRLCFYACVGLSLPALALLGLLAWCACGQERKYVTRNNGGDFVQRFPRIWTEKTVRTVLIWDSKFPFSVEEGGAGFAACAESRCHVTRDRKSLEASDAIIMSSRGIFNNLMPFYPMPQYRHPSQVWIMAEMEAPPETQLDWRRYNGVFNWTLHYRRDADLQGSYGSVIEDPSLGNVPVKNYHAEKTHMVGWMSSNCLDDARRQRVVQELSRHVSVDTWGKCGDRVATGCPEHQCDRHMKKYKFWLSLENSKCRDYITEKFYHAYDRDQIAITDSVVASTGYAHAPHGSYISISDFSSIKDLAKYLKKLAANATAYNDYLSWRRTHVVTSYAAPMCQLCRKLHDRTEPAQVYTDLYGWLENDTCRPWSLCNFIWRIYDGLGLKYRLIS